jgi:sugar phosphate isomerase/epimerase
MFGVTTWMLPVRGVKALDWAAGRGFSFVHLDPDDVVGSGDAARVRAHAVERGIGLGAVAVKDLERVGLASPDLGRNAVDRTVDLAEELGVGYIYLPSFGAAAIGDAGALVRTADLFAYALQRTAGTGIVVASENALSADRVRRLFSLVGDPRARLLFDTQNPVAAGLDCVALAEQVADLVGDFVHVKDGRLALGDTVIGHGACPVQQTLRALGGSPGHRRYVIESDYRAAEGRRPVQDRRHLAAMLRDASRCDVPT